MPSAVSDPAEPGGAERKTLLNLSTQSTLRACCLLGGFPARGGDVLPWDAWEDAEAAGRWGIARTGLGHGRKS